MRLLPLVLFFAGSAGTATAQRAGLPSRFSLSPYATLGMASDEYVLFGLGAQLDQALSERWGIFTDLGVAAIGTGCSDQLGAGCPGSTWYLFGGSRWWLAGLAHPTRPFVTLAVGHVQFGTSMVAARGEAGIEFRSYHRVGLRASVSFTRLFRHGDPHQFGVLAGIRIRL